ERQLEELDARSARGEYVAAAHYVFAHIKRGNLEDAFALLPKMAEEPDWFALQMRVNPLLDPLRSDPRFEALVSQVFSKNQEMEGGAPATPVATAWNLNAPLGLAGARPSRRPLGRLKITGRPQTTRD